MPRRADDLTQTLSVRELRDIVARLGEDLGLKSPPASEAAASAGDSFAEASAILDQVHVLRAMLRSMGPKAPACFTDRIVAAALDVDPVDPGERIDLTTIHRLDR